MTRNRGGLWVPVELGQGKFARVLCGQQQIGNQPARSVAIKILHSHATLAHERLFATEIAHLRKLSDADNVNVLHILDVLQLRPLVLCGCGKVYSRAAPPAGKSC
ncbi:protein kinase [Nannocystis pusilla]|uniref:Protein kinase n=1 Tax=Nannocystis pusilla TaxID=889268 RepID=A0A9X3ERP2_9BACT|nr:protein kinase [Nannocystis pusilla]MCY1008660.1 protein kinase [Nannocystis pusilla]